MKSYNLDLHLNNVWRHVRTNHLYKILAYDKYKIEGTNEDAVVYTRIDENSTRWVRPISEFLDGRFKRMLSVPTDTVMDKEEWGEDS